MTLTEKCKWAPPIARIFEDEDEEEGRRDKKEAYGPHPDRKEVKTLKFNAGTQRVSIPARKRLAASRKPPLRSRQRWRHEAYGASSEAV